MAVTSGIFDVTTGGKVALDLLNHILPNSSTVATGVTITGPIVMRLTVTTTSTNSTPATSCSDTNYSAVTQGAVTWNTAAQTVGAGSAAGFEAKTNSIVNTYFGSTGAAAAQTITGVMFFSQDGTPVAVMYENFSPAVSVPQGNQFSFPVTTGIVNQLG